MIVHLGFVELIVGAIVGIIRRVSSLKAGDRDRLVSDEDPWVVDIRGALGEMALAKALNIYWKPGVRTFKAPDVGGFQVRCTPKPCLILRDWDKNPDEIYVLVNVKRTSFTIVGWIQCSEGKTEKHRKDPTSFFVRPEYLGSWEKLKAMSEKARIDDRPPSP